MSDCPTCFSTDTQYLKMIHAGGLSTIQIENVGARSGTKFSDSTGTQQTALSKQAAPPEVRDVVKPALGIIAGLVLIFAFDAMILGLLVAGISGFLMRRAMKWNNTVFPGLYRTWEQTVMCKRCGTVFPAALPG